MGTVAVRPTIYCREDSIGNRYILAILRFFGVADDQIDPLSLREIKRRAKEQYIGYLFKSISALS